MAVRSFKHDLINHVGVLRELANQNGLAVCTAASRAFCNTFPIRVVISNISNPENHAVYNLDAYVVFGISIVGVIYSIFLTLGLAIKNSRPSPVWIFKSNPSCIFQIVSMYSLTSSVLF